MSGDTRCQEREREREKERKERTVARCDRRRRGTTGSKNGNHGDDIVFKVKVGVPVAHQALDLLRSCLSRRGQ